MPLPQPETRARQPLDLETPPLSSYHVQLVVQDLDTALVPSAEEGSRARRLIIVGDVHGHLAELKKLLEETNFDRHDGDHLVFVGDLVNKGPDSAGVVQLAMDLGASCVRGNNEDRVLAAHAALKRGKEPRAEPQQHVDAAEGGDAKTGAAQTQAAPVGAADARPTESRESSGPEKGANESEAQPSKPDDAPAGPAEAEAAEPGPANSNDFSNSAKDGKGIEFLPPLELKKYYTANDVVTASTLSDSQASWLSSQPLILRIGPLKGATAAPWNAGYIIVAHAGLVPSLPLEEQDHWAVMNMRGLVYPDAGVDDEGIRAAVVKGVGSRTRRYVAFNDASEDDIEAEWMRLRSLFCDGQGFSGINKDCFVGRPLELREGQAWTEAWNMQQNSTKSPEERSVVVFGHDARLGLQVEPEIELPETRGTPARKGLRYAFGLDSGCVYGNQLSAMVIEVTSGGQGISHSIVQVEGIKKESEA
ncbi:hypothetical protein ACJ41O_012746 [Fusarium nematophilum]